MIRYLLVIGLFFTPIASYAECAFDFNGTNDCGEDYQSIYEEEPQQDYSGGCTCQETSPSTTSTQWVPNPSGSGGNYETVTTPGYTRSVPCPC